MMRQTPRPPVLIILLWWHLAQIDKGSKLANWSLWCLAHNFRKLQRDVDTHPANNLKPALFAATITATLTIQREAG